MQYLRVLDRQWTVDDEHRDASLRRHQKDDGVYIAVVTAGRIFCLTEYDFVMNNLYEPEMLVDI